MTILLIINLQGLIEGLKNEACEEFVFRSLPK